ncbi:MAG: addiction module protein [Phycisphaerales bacterium]
MTDMHPHFDYLNLPKEERLALSQELFDSVVAEEQHAPLTPQQLARARQTLADIDAGRVVCEPLDVVMKRLRRQWP